MEAIFIERGTGAHGNQFDRLNKDLKDCVEILERIDVDRGIILIVKKETRKEKLKKLDDVES